MTTGSFGIVAMGHRLGEHRTVATAAADYTADRSRLDMWGYRGFHRAATGVGLTDLAESAGRLALERAAVPAADVDLLVVATSGIAEYLYWDPAAATQHRLGAHRAEALLLNQACGAGVVAFDAVAGKFATQPHYRTALIIAANRVCEPYWNRMESTTSVSSDGAAAAVVVRGHDRARWLATATVTDGTYADFFRLETGGAAQPFLGGGPAPDVVASPFDRLEDFFGRDHDAMLRFVDAVGHNLRDVFGRACAQAGVEPHAVARVIHQNENVRGMHEVAAELGVPADRTNVELSLDHGSLGAADQLFGLEHHLAAGELHSGDLVALTTVGSGMHWACTLLRI